MPMYFAAPRSSVDGAAVSVGVSGAFSMAADA
jgi:hypothetical protein